MLRPPAREQPPAPAAAEPGERVASTFANMALVVVRRPGVLDAPSAALVASAAEAAALGDFGLQLRENGLHLSQAVVDRANGLDQVAAGALGGLLVARFEPEQALRTEMAQHPDLVVLPLGPSSAARPPDAAALEAVASPPPTTGNAPRETAAESDGPAAQAFAVVDQAGR